jgi:hypothetical protein
VTEHEHPFPGNAVGRVVNFEDSESEVIEQVHESTLNKANVLTSRVAGSTWQHRPVLDIDFPAKLVPSSTPGHFHLYLDCPMDWETYETLLVDLAGAGVIQPGYAAASISRKATSVRLPWIRKAVE